MYERYQCTYKHTCIYVYLSYTLVNNVETCVAILLQWYLCTLKVTMNEIYEVCSKPYV